MVSPPSHKDSGQRAGREHYPFRRMRKLKAHFFWHINILYIWHISEYFNYVIIKHYISTVLLLFTLYNILHIVHIIIIIKQGWQCKAGRERLTPYQSKDPNPTIPTHRMKEEKGKTAGNKKWAGS